MKQLTSHQGMHCANCGAVMQGEFCHDCGQSIRSVLKPLHGMIEETLDTVINVDGRIVHTLPPLLLKPGFLTMEYFAGRRVRYIAPFRLMVVLSLLLFFVLRLSVDQISSKSQDWQQTANVTGESFADADTPAEVRETLHRELASLPTISAVGVMPQRALDRAAENMRQKANERLLELQATPVSAASAAAPSMVGATSSDPIRVTGLPDVVNARLTTLAGQLRSNWRTSRDGDPQARAEAKQRMINGAFGALPPAMFVLIPLFALMLQLFYVFRRRLYMEHLVIALHSHAFMCASLLLIVLCGMLSTWLRPYAAWVGAVLGVVQGGLMLWIPTYLLIMQKRVYGQGWPMTLFKFWLVSGFYFWLLLLVLVVAAALGAAN